MESDIEMSIQHIVGKSPQPGNVYQYNKTGSRADMAGELYEIKMTLLLFLRGINRTACFYLASNVDGAGAFDDILFKFKLHGDNDTFKTCFLQLKHKQRKPVVHEKEKKNTKPLTVEGLYSNNGDFSLGKYHESYCEVADRMKMCSETSDFLFNGSFDNTWFVIYTNAPVERKLLNHEKTQEYSNQNRNILSSGGEKEFIFHFHDEDAINYKQSKHTPDLSNSKKEFLDALMIYCGQASEAELNKFIEEEVECALHTSKTVTESISKELTAKIADWWKDSSDILTETSIIWQEIIASRIEIMTSSMKVCLDKFEVNYDMQVMHSFYSSLCNSPMVLVTGSETKLTSLKVLQTLNKFHAKQFIFVDLKSLLLTKREVLCLWQSSWCLVLAVDCSSNDIGGEFVDLMNEWSQTTPGKLILLVANSSQTFPKAINLTLLVDRCMTVHDSFSFMQLDVESRLKILDKQIIFQGVPVSLGSVLKENTDVISGDVIGQLLSPHYEFTIGSRLANLISYYIPRRLERFDCLKYDILHNCRTEYFVISCALEREIQELLPYGEKVTKYVAGVTDITSHFLIADQLFSEQDFKNVCLQNSNKSLHWLTFDEDSLVWKQSNLNFTLIRQNVDCNRYSVHSNAHNVVKDRVVIVTAEPGMGKSTLITHLAKQVQEEDPTLLIIRVDLNDTTTLLEEIDEDHFTNLNNTVQFLLSATIANDKLTEDIKGDFETKLFKSYMKTFKNVVIFFDGFDEISPDFTNEVISLLKCLLTTKVKKLWVTSRNVVRGTLETALSLISYTLQPFTAMDQHSFLIQYWNSVMNVGELEQLKQFAGLLLEVTSKSLNDREKEFTSFPLQTFMLAESFKHEVNSFIANGINCLPTRLNLLDLYERFIEKKQNLYYKEKAKWDTSKAASRREIQRLKKLFICNHMNAALVLLLSPEQTNVLHAFKLEDANDFLADISNVDEKQGIIDGMIGNKPHFIHRTFAEYFLALWLSQHLTTVQVFIQMNLFTENYQTIRYFFDCILSKGCQFHNAVLSGDKEYFQSFLSTENVNVNSHDTGNRTALHIAASYPGLELSVNQNSVQMLLDHGAHVNAIDSVLQWTPLRYADATKLWNHIDTLLCMGGHLDDLVKTKENICDTEMLCTVVERGYFKLLAFALDCNVDINIIVRERENSTLLHMAANAGNIQSVDFLLSKGANVDCRDVSSRSPLHLAACKGHLAVMESLVRDGGDVMCRDDEGTTPLHWAASYGHIEVAEYLVGRGAHIMSQTADYITPLQLASGSGHLNIVQFLKEKGADIMSCDLYKTTPLQEAAECGHLNVVQYLVECGADVNSCDTGDKMPLHWACRSGHFLVAEFLVVRGADVMSRMTGVTQPLHWAAEMGHEEVVIFLLKKGADLDAKDQEGATPLILAAGNGHLKVVECLVHKGANVTLSQKNGQSPLMQASEKGHLPVVSFLVDNGADVASSSQYGITPLHSAVQYGHLEVVKYLVSKGACIDARDSESQTPLELATVCQQWDTVQWLSTVRNTNVLTNCQPQDTTKSTISNSNNSC